MNFVRQMSLVIVEKPTKTSGVNRYDQALDEEQTLGNHCCCNSFVQKELPDAQPEGRNTYSRRVCRDERRERTQQLRTVHLPFHEEMAIPFVMPSDDEAGDQGQRLEQLMLDLYAALQQVLRSRAAQHASRNRESNGFLNLVGTYLEIFLLLLLQRTMYRNVY
ncbi:unnamed protein product [Heterotrigona itama]|uniref:Uncharacterized protein n=1 Tax=Heterotrigona itama TaxID=395501 RepID=A0A6V7HK18_9HYME|nr:unnamed protein product [Heterotrigona itama]